MYCLICIILAIIGLATKTELILIAAGLFAIADSIYDVANLITKK